MYCTVYMWGKWTYKRIDIAHTCFHTSNNKKISNVNEEFLWNMRAIYQFLCVPAGKIWIVVTFAQLIGPDGTKNSLAKKPTAAASGKKCVTGPPANHWLTKLRGHWRHLITNSKSPKNILLRAVSRKCLNPSICQKRFCKILWNRHYICYLELSLCEPNTYH